MKTRNSTSAIQAVDLVARYFDAMSNRDLAAMQVLRSTDFVVDLVFRDAYGAGSSAGDYYGALFAAFTEMDFERTRTVAADSVTVVEWTFVGKNTGPVAPPLLVLAGLDEARGRTVKLRGVTVFDIARGTISRETVYLDQATLLVELGISAGTGK